MHDKLLLESMARFSLRMELEAEDVATDCEGPLFDLGLLR